MGTLDRYRAGKLHSCMDCPAARLDLEPLFDKNQPKSPALHPIVVPDTLPEGWANA